MQERRTRRNRSVRRPPKKFFIEAARRVVSENVGMARGSGPTASPAKAQTLPGAERNPFAGVGETSRRADCDQSNPPPGEAQTAIVQAHRSWIARRNSDGVTPLQKRGDERRVRSVRQGVLDLADRHVGHCEQLARLRIAHLIENGLEAGPLDWRSPSDARRRRGWWEPAKNERPNRMPHSVRPQPGHSQRARLLPSPAGMTIRPARLPVPRAGEAARARRK